ncbi:MAG TPA: chlorite dismutase family protein [Polyangiaceae bacterium]|nr:chlorite dismutase family protein [Polyangiaceae bacterium]
MSQPEAKPPGLPTIDVLEYGGKRDGTRQAIDRRLFMELVVFKVDAGKNAEEFGRKLAQACALEQVQGVIYADAVHPRGLGLLAWSDDPSHFVRKVRPLFAREGLADVRIRADFGMLGRTYGTGHEPDLEWTLLRRPVENVLNEAYPWHVWYPLRRTGGFARLEPHEQSNILREHAQIGMAYGAQELAHDVRLACHGLDAADNEFVIGLVGRDLHPLSHLVQAMRRTRQTSEFIEKMGPFFVGYALHRVR